MYKKQKNWAEGCAIVDVATEVSPDAMIARLMLIDAASIIDVQSLKDIKSDNSSASTVVR